MVAMRWLYCPILGACRQDSCRNAFQTPVVCLCECRRLHPMSTLHTAPRGLRVPGRAMFNPDSAHEFHQDNSLHRVKWQEMQARIESFQPFKPGKNVSGPQLRTMQSSRQFHDPQSSPVAVEASPASEWQENLVEGVQWRIFNDAPLILEFHTGALCRSLLLYRPITKIARRPISRQVCFDDVRDR